MCIFCNDAPPDSNARSDDEVLAAERCPNLAERVPATIVTGFLGAGKTTLVNWLLQGSHGRRFCVLQNEFGAVPVDDALIVRNQKFADVAVVTLATGCVCCKVRGDLVEGLQALARGVLAGKEAGGGASGHFDAIIVETSGLSEVGPVAQTFFADRFVQRNFRLDAVLAVVDAQTAPDAVRMAQAQPDGADDTEPDDDDESSSDPSDSGSESEDAEGAVDGKGGGKGGGGGTGGGTGGEGGSAVTSEDEKLRLQAAKLLCEQICLADVILLNKFDLASDEQRGEAMSLLASVNASAAIVPTTRAQVDLAAVLDLKSFSLKRALSVDEAFLRDAATGGGDGDSGALAVDVTDGGSSGGGEGGAATKPGSVAFAFARPRLRPAGTSGGSSSSSGGASAGSGGGGSGGGSSSQHLHAQFASVGLEATRELDELSFNDWLEAIFTKHGKRLFRAKGVLFFDGSDEPTAVQCVGGHVECERIPLEEVDPAVASRRRSRLVFIGRTAGIERELRDGFARV